MEFFESLVSKEANSSKAIEKLQSEHTDSQQHIKDLEARLEKIQDNLQTKLNDLDAIQEKNASLHQEIISLKNSFGYVRGTEISYCPPLHFQYTSNTKANVLAKPSEKVLYSRFMQSSSTVNMLRGKSSSRMVRFPVSSLMTIDKSLAPSNSTFLLRKQSLACPSTSSIGGDELGQGQDYLRTLFADTKKTTSESVGKPGKPHVSSEYYDSPASSAVGNIKIVEVHPSGHFVKIHNKSPDKEESIGDYTLQQNLNGHPIAIFKFPPKIRVKANASVTVWAMSSKKPHKPPTDYLWKDLYRFKPGPECITILCNPTGQAVAWFTPIKWSRTQTKEDEENVHFRENLTQPVTGEYQHKDHWETFDKHKKDDSDILSEDNEVDFILREEETKPTLYPVQSSWCRSPDTPTHPHYTMGRYLHVGGKGGQSNSQSRSQPLIPNLDSDISYASGGPKTRSAGGGTTKKTRTRPTRSAGECKRLIL